MPSNNRGDEAEMAIWNARRRAANAHDLDGFFAQAPIGTPAAEAQAAGAISAPPEVPGWATRWDSLTELERKAQRSRWEALLTPIVIEMGTTAAGYGVIANEVLSRGISDGVLNGERLFLKMHPRIYSWIGHFLGRLATDGVLAEKWLNIEGGGKVRARREAGRGTSKGNLNDIYVLAAFATDTAARSDAA